MPNEKPKEAFILKGAIIYTKIYSFFCKNFFYSTLARFKKMFGLIPLIGIFFLNVEYVEKANAAGKNQQPTLQKIETNNNEELPEVVDAGEKYGIIEEINNLNEDQSGYNIVKLYNKKALYIMAEILVKTTLTTDFVETFGPKFRELREFLDKKAKFDKNALKNLKLEFFFQHLSGANDGQKRSTPAAANIIYKIVPLRESNKEESGFYKLLGPNLERELNKLCENYKSKKSPQQENAYHEICTLATERFNKQFAEAEKTWDWYLSPEGIYYKTDVCYIPPRLSLNKLERRRAKKVANLDTYRAGMSDAEYLVYWLLKMIPQIEPKFKLRPHLSYNPEPYAEIQSDKVRISDANLCLPKEKPNRSHGGSCGIFKAPWNGGGIDLTAFGMAGGF